MKHHEDCRVNGSKALVVSAVSKDDGREASPGNCTVCSGPARLCGGVQHCTGGPRSVLELQWLTAIRAVYAGLVLTRTLAALWGGALLRFAHQLALGALASGSPPASIARLAEEHADPGGAASGSVMAGLALAYLHHGDLERLSELSRLLRDTRAPWLLELQIIGPLAALSTPLDPERFPLFAVRCNDCADAAVRPHDRLYERVATYDAAIRCPRCGALPAHPLPGVRIGEPHPVGRCLPGAGAAAQACRVHDGQELDVEGLCVEGRSTLLQAVLVGVKLDQKASTPFERDLMQALGRAHRITLKTRLDDAAVARAMVTSPVLMPFFAALAVANPEAGRDLAQIAGAPLDTDAADPTVLAAMSGGSGLAGLIANGRAAIAGLRASLSPAPPVPAFRPSPTPRRRKEGRR